MWQTSVRVYYCFCSLCYLMLGSVAGWAEAQPSAAAAVTWCQSACWADGGGWLIFLTMQKLLLPPLLPTHTHTQSRCVLLFSCWCRQRGAVKCACACMWVWVGGCARVCVCVCQSTFIKGGLLASPSRSMAESVKHIIVLVHTRQC